MTLDKTATPHMTRRIRQWTGVGMPCLLLLVIACEHRDRPGQQSKPAYARAVLYDASTGNTLYSSDNPVIASRIADDVAAAPYSKTPFVWNTKEERAKLSLFAKNGSEIRLVLFSGDRAMILGDQDVTRCRKLSLDNITLMLQGPTNSRPSSDVEVSSAPFDRP